MVRVNISRYKTYGAEIRPHRGKPYLDLVGSEQWKSFIVENLDSFEYKVAIIPASMEYRPDMIAHSVYGTEKLWWFTIPNLKSIKWINDMINNIRHQL